MCHPDIRCRPDASSFNPVLQAVESWLVRCIREASSHEAALETALLLFEAIRVEFESVRSGRVMENEIKNQFNELDDFDEIDEYEDDSGDEMGTQAVVMDFETQRALLSIFSLITGHLESLSKDQSEASNNENVLKSCQLLMDLVSPPILEPITSELDRH